MKHAKQQPKARRADTIAAAEYFRSKLLYEQTPYALHELMETKPGTVFLVDVRGAEQFAQGRIPGATNIPLEEIPKKFASLPKDKMVVTYCGDITCALSLKAALQLSEKGVRVQHLLGGIAEWSKKGFTVETGKPEPGRSKL